MVSSVCFGKPPINTWALCEHTSLLTLIHLLYIAQGVEGTQNLLTVWSPRFSPEMWRRSFHCLCGHTPHRFHAWFPDRGQGGFPGLGSLSAARGSTHACTQRPLRSQRPEV